MSILLPHANRPTSALGFGGAYLAGGFDAAASRRLVDVAYDAGFRHFDVAPAYGMGQAEDVLGAALRDKRDTVTIATKVGLARPKAKLSSQLIRAAAGPIRKVAPGLTRRLGTSMYQSTVARGQFDVAFVAASVAESLRRLKIEKIDLLLLHEARLEDLSDELLSYLDKGRAEGLFGALGVASTHDRVMAIAGSDRAAAFDVLQYSWSVLDVDAAIPGTDKFRITHRAIMRALGPVKAWIEADPRTGAALSQAVGLDLGAGENLSNVLLGAALATNPTGICLVGSRNAGRIRANAAAMSDPALVEAGRRLVKAFSERPDRPLAA